jgi:uncharacterized protein (UPF0218 family)
LSKLVLTEKLRSSLKRPLGLLLAGGGPEVYRQLAEKIARHNPPRVILVGDAVSRSAISHNVRSDLMILDNREKRGAAKPVPFDVKRTFLVRNEPGTISAEAWAGVDEAVERGAAVMIVDGEEDLLALAAIAVAPLESIVAYGQPDEGLVVVQVDREMKRRVGCLLQAMKRTG